MEKCTNFILAHGKNVINRPVWRSPSVDFSSLSHKERMDGTNLRVWLNASKRLQIHWEHWSLKIPYWKQLRFGLKNNPSGLLTGHRSVSGFPAPYGCGWCRLPSQASSPGWCSWVWWSQRTASWQMEHGGTDHPPLFGVVWRPQSKASRLCNWCPWIYRGVPNAGVNYLKLAGEKETHIVNKLNLVAGWSDPLSQEYEPMVALSIRKLRWIIKRIWNHHQTVQDTIKQFGTQHLWLSVVWGPISNRMWMAHSAHLKHANVLCSWKQITRCLNLNSMTYILYQDRIRCAAPMWPSVAGRTSGTARLELSLLQPELAPWLEF